MVGIFLSLLTITVVGVGTVAVVNRVSAYKQRTLELEHERTMTQLP
jgi:hypothetical protein